MYLAVNCCIPGSFTLLSVSGTTVRDAEVACSNQVAPTDHKPCLGIKLQPAALCGRAGR